MCGHCGERTEIFSSWWRRGGCKKIRDPVSWDEYPLDPAIREGGDQGKPIVVKNPESPQAQAFHEIVRTLVSRLKQGEGDASGSTPTLSSLLKKIKDPLKKSS